MKDKEIYTELIRARGGAGSCMIGIPAYIMRSMDLKKGDKVLVTITRME